MKKLITLLMIIMMSLCLVSLSGCGGEDGSSSGTAERNGDITQEEITDGFVTGIGGVLFTVPDGWEKTSASEGKYIVFTNPDYDFSLGARNINEENLSQFADITEVETIEDYYNVKTKKNSDGTEREKNVDIDNTKLLENKARVVKVKNDKGYVDVSTYCMMNGEVYNFYIERNDASDLEGNINKDAKPLEDDEMAIYDRLLASVKHGDGAELQMEGVTAKGLGDVAFDPPDGFRIIDVRENHVGFKKDDGIELSVSLTNEDELEYSADENGMPYKSLKDMYNGMKGDGGGSVTIAGVEGFRGDSTEEVRFLDAGFVLNNGFYYVSMNADYNSVLPTNDSVIALSEEDIKAFDAFLESMRPRE